MGISLPGIIGAAIGVGIGILDFGMIAALVRRAIAARKAKDPAAPTRGRVGEGVMKILFALNALLFAALGYWFGSTIGG